MPLTTIVFRCVSCAKPAEYDLPGRLWRPSEVAKRTGADGWRSRMQGKKLEWLCRECLTAQARLNSGGQA